jgi:hypothetical protein
MTEIIPEPIQKTFEVEITGIKPLLMHNPISSMKVAEEWKAKGVSHPPTDVDAESGLYKDSEGNIVIPFLNILGTIRVGAADRKIGGKGHATYKKLVFSGLEITEENPKLIYDKWIQDTRPVVIGSARIMRTRPRFDKWSLIFRIKVIDPVWLNPVNMGGEILKSIIETSGRKGGLGDFRPLFGQFTITRFEEISNV